MSLSRAGGVCIGREGQTRRIGARIALWVRRLHRKGKVAPSIAGCLPPRQEEGIQQWKAATATNLDLPDDLKESSLRISKVTSEFKAYFDGPRNRPTTHGTKTHSERSWTTNGGGRGAAHAPRIAVAKGRIPKANLSGNFGYNSRTPIHFFAQGSADVSPFPTTYLCEAGFSVMFDLKPKRKST
ncbi:hypothetical protein GWK47_023028 [Chionoecetes opilio]|uniref:Uncharacterized protein n=1 Tax=Chionoecetes opilio TaxID=41210 RepID=A0A8J4XRP1_CHIOP|nr:hypothetical protein GWK47_023028 [Chionoecetes opilio]